MTFSNDRYELNVRKAFTKKRMQNVNIKKDQMYERERQRYRF